jgi:cytochrome P450
LLSLAITDAERSAAIDAAEQMHSYLEALIEERRVAPRDDLLSALMTATEDGATLSRPELLSLAATLYAAGHRTTRDLFTNGLFTLLGKPERYRAVVDGQWSTPDVVSEMLRYETPTIFVVRITSEKATIAGVTVPAGAPILIYLAAANRDPEAYEQPNEFRPGRDGPPSLSFAFGAHYCLGASLARMEAETMLNAVVVRWPNLSLAPDAAPQWQLSGPFRRLDALYVASAA